MAAEQSAPALRARRLVVSELWSERLTPILASQLGLAAADPRAQTAASMVLAAMGLRERTLARAMLERAGAREVERRVRAVVDEAFGRLAQAFADVDRPGAQPAGTASSNGDRPVPAAGAVLGPGCRAPRT